jgi:hypothetical protein
MISNRMIIALLLAFPVVTFAQANEETNSRAHAIWVAQTLKASEVELQKYADMLKVDIEAFTRRGIDADRERADLEALMPIFSTVKSNINSSIMLDANSYNPNSAQQSKSFNNEVTLARDQLYRISRTMHDVIGRLKSKINDLSSEISREASSTPAPIRPAIKP